VLLVSLPGAMPVHNTQWRVIFWNTNKGKKNILLAGTSLERFCCEDSVGKGILSTFVF
jgi:hypothetical protein